MSETALWAASGAMSLTGRPDGPPQVSPGRPATAVRDALARIRAVHPNADLPDVTLLGERASTAGLRRNSPWSCGGAFRVLATADGHLALSLPRPADLDVVPALVCAKVSDPWRAVQAWAAQTPTVDAVARARVLGLACSEVGGETSSERRDPVVVTRRTRPKEQRVRPLVVDFTSLWAGPLSAHLLSLCGAEVVKVESTRRLDGARRGPAAFFDLLHAGHHSVVVDFESAEEISALRRLVGDADLVLEASRPRALRRLGLVAEDLVAEGTSWLSITAYGRDSDFVGFGDDVAAGAGLVTPDMMPCGDALADPLAGVTAAAYAAEALAGPDALLIDVSMHHVARAAAQGGTEPHTVVRSNRGWWVECDAGNFLVAEPVGRRAPRRAAEPGWDNAALLFSR